MSARILKAGLQSGTIMAVADTATQFLIEGTAQRQYDPARTLRWGIAGLTCHGPYFFVGFSFVDKYFGGAAAATSFSTVAKKTVFAQLVLFPPYLVLLFSLMGVLEGKSTQRDIVQKVQQRVPEAFASGCVYWPVANSLNFYLVPSGMRVPYLALSAGIWNSYLSWANARANKVAANWWKFWR